MTELVKHFTVIQGDKKYSAPGYASACQMVHNLMKDNQQPCVIEVVFLSMENTHAI